MTHCPRTLDEAAWYVNDTLPAAVRKGFEAHLPGCAECRAALAMDSRLVATLAATAANVLPAPQTAWARLQERLDSGSAQVPGEPARAKAGARRAGPGRHRLMQFAIVAQAATILLLISALWGLLEWTEVRTFRTLGSQDSSLASPEPLVRVVLAPGHSSSTASDIARAAGAELRSRTEGTDIYTFAIPVRTGERRSDRVAAVVAALRQAPEVLMAEPMTDPQVPGG